MMFNSLRCLLLLSLGVLASGVAAERRAAGAPADFITVADGQFVLNGQPYTAVGVTNYPFTSGNIESIERVLYHARAAGITLVRAVNVFSVAHNYGAGGADFSRWNEEAHWREIDRLLDLADRLGMHVLLDLSDFRTVILDGLNIDPWSADAYPYYDEMVAWVTQRVNGDNGCRYADDPTIFQWLISGEPVPYGFTGNIHNMSRHVNVIEDLIFHVAEELKEHDPNHLVSAGGLLHFSGVPLDRHGQAYWRTIWSHPAIDCGAIHVYPGSFGGELTGEWTRLDEYQAYCQSIGKPLVLEEWGINQNEHDEATEIDYLTRGFDRAWELGIPVNIYWNWDPVGGYSIFTSRAEPLLAILSANAVRWGAPTPFPRFAEAVITGPLLFDFEAPAEAFVSTGYGGNAGPPTISADRAWTGEHALAVPVSFPSTAWNFAGVLTEFNPTRDWRGAGFIACNVWVPEHATDLSIKFMLHNVEEGWIAYVQQPEGERNNWLLPGQWNQVYADLRPESLAFTRAGTAAAPALDRVVRLTLEIHHAAGGAPYSGPVYIDALRLGDARTPYTSVGGHVWGRMR